MQGWPRDAALAGKPLADVRVDPLAQRLTPSMRVFMIAGFVPLFASESGGARHH